MGYKARQRGVNWGDYQHFKGQTEKERSNGKKSSWRGPWGNGVPEAKGGLSRKSKATDKVKS